MVEKGPRFHTAPLKYNICLSGIYVYDIVHFTCLVVLFIDFAITM